MYATRKAKQEWIVGNRVNVGFIRDLLIVAKVPTPGDGRPDYYRLVAPNGKRYIFTPHNGLEQE